jgi:hypothetical protein
MIRTKIAKLNPPLLVPGEGFEVEFEKMWVQTSNPTPCYIISQSIKQGILAGDLPVEIGNILTVLLRDEVPRPALTSCATVKTAGGFVPSQFC